MQTSEHRRILIVFSLLGIAFAAIFVRLLQLQVWRVEQGRRSAHRQGGVAQELPAPRGTILDCKGRLLAYDRPVLEVRAEIALGRMVAREPEAGKGFADRLAADLAFALAAGSPHGFRKGERGRLRQRILARLAKHRGAMSSSRRRIDFLVSSRVESARVIARLHETERQRPRLHLHFIRRYLRTYPHAELTDGAIGFVGDLDLGGGRNAKVHRGLESFVGLRRGRPGSRRALRDAHGRHYWSAEQRVPSSAPVLQCTLDLDLQSIANEELQRAVAAVTKHYGSPPNWGALCLAEVAGGNVLAMVSCSSAGPQRATAFAPAQNLCPPGSVVKPLIFAVGLERGALDWDARFDCRPNAGGRSWWVPGSRRKITDAHVCGLLTPREILVQSSNIGASQVGRLLGVEGLQAYLRHYGIGARTGSSFPGERRGKRPHELSSMPERMLQVWTAPSLSIGYEQAVTPLQILRAYLALVSGRERHLRLVERIEIEGRVSRMPRRDEGSPRFLSARTVHTILEALTGVVSDEPHATGRRLAAELRKLGVRSGLIAGKTGTSEYTERRRGKDGRSFEVEVKTASFAGLAPARAPRYVAVCVIQKDRGAAFWGGSYAAPAAGRLLLRVLARETADRSLSDRHGVKPAGVPRLGGEGGQAFAATTTGR